VSVWTETGGNGSPESDGEAERPRGLAIFIRSAGLGDCDKTRPTLLLGRSERQPELFFFKVSREGRRETVWTLPRPGPRSPNLVRPFATLRLTQAWQLPTSCFGGGHFGSGFAGLRDRQKQFRLADHKLIDQLPRGSPNFPPFSRPPGRAFSTGASKTALALEAGPSVASSLFEATANLRRH